MTFSVEVDGMSAEVWQDFLSWLGRQHYVSEKCG